MFGIILIIAVVAGGGYIAITEVNKATWQKFQTGDICNVPCTSLSAGNVTDDAALKTFLAGFTTVTVRVSNVVLDATAGLGHGIVPGFPLTLNFPLTSIASLDRGGSRIV